MKFKSTLLAQASGSLAGNVFARNKGGQYIRARGLVKNSNTAAQQNVRNSLKTLSQSWTSILTETQRDAWTTYAKNVPLVNSLGDPTIISGLAMYIRCNSPRLSAGIAAVLDGPTTMTLGTFTPVTAAINHTTGWSIVFDDTDEWANADGGAMIFYQSRPLSVGVNFFKGPFQYFSITLGATMTPPISPTTPPNLFPGAAGNGYFLRIQATLADGRLTSAQILKLVAT